MSIKPFLFNQSASFLVNSRLRDYDAFMADITLFKNKLTQLAPQSHVVLYHPDTYQFAVRLFALSNLGHHIVLPPNGQPETLNSLLKQTAIFCGDDSCLLSTDDILNIEAEPEKTCSKKKNIPWPTDAMLVFYTSGSSGQSKPIVKPWSTVNRELSVLTSSFDLRGELTFLATVSHQHIYGLLFRLLWPLLNGHIIDTDQIQYPEHIAQKLANTGKAVLISSPAQLARLSSDNVLIEQKKQLQWVFSSGGPLQDPHAILLSQQLGRPITQIYGSTETGGIAYRQVIDKLNIAPWQPFNGNSLSTQPDGRLVLNSYILQERNVELDDRASLLKGGQFHLLGRIDRTIKIEEKRLNLDELEALLLSHDWVKEAKLIVLPTQRIQIGAVIVLTPEAEHTLAQQGKLTVNRQFLHFLSSRFERICLPRKWRYIKSLPYNSQAKLNIKTMEQYFVKTD